MYLIIGIWGGPNRIYATIKFVLYTLVGSLLMLVAILATAFAFATAHGGDFTGAFDYEQLRGFAFSDVLQTGAFLAFFLAFAIKVPMVPVPHLAARRPRGGPHRRLGDPGRRAAQAGRLRLHPLLAAPLPARGAVVRGAASSSCR